MILHCFDRRNSSSGSTKIVVEAYRQSNLELFTIYVTVVDGYEHQVETSVKL